MGEIKAGVVLRQYQQHCKEQIKEKLSQGKRLMFQLPTGAGKTELALSVIDDLVSDQLKVLWVTHRIELVSQVVDRALRYGIPTVDLYAGHPLQDYGLHVQSVIKARSLMASTSWRPALLVIDEAHHATAPTWARLVEGFRDAGTSVLGMTATPWRLSRKQGYDHLFDDLFCGPQTLRLIEDGYLTMPLVVRARAPDVHGAGVRVGASGDYSVADMERRLGASMVSTPVEAWEQWCASRRTIVYAVSRRIALDIAARIQTLGGKVGVLYSETKDDRDDANWCSLVEGARSAGVVIGTSMDRMQVVTGFASGDLDVVVNVEIFTEGIDVPGADAVILGRPTKSLALQRQMVGRVLRVADGKADALIVDCAGTINEPGVGHPIADYEWSLKPRSSGSENGTAPVRECRCGNQNPVASHYCLWCRVPQGQWCLRCRAWRGGWLDGVSQAELEADVRTGAELARAYHVDKTIAVCERCEREIEVIREERASSRADRQEAEHPLRCPRCQKRKKPQYDFCFKCGMDRCFCGRWKQRGRDRCVLCRTKLPLPIA